MEIKLFGVARGSLHELLNDYEDYMRTRFITRWKENHPRYTPLINTCRENNESAFYVSLVPKMNDEEYCNLMLTLIHQTIVMLNKMIDLVKKDFIKNGGIKEQMHNARINYKNNNPK